MSCQYLGMATSPLSSVLSPAQIAVVQQARALVAQPRPPQAVQATETAPPQRAVPPTAQGRGRIINITV
jgi:hypothetical protein